jgi:hypothetical protein
VKLNSWPGIGSDGEVLLTPYVPKGITGYDDDDMCVCVCVCVCVCACMFCVWVCVCVFISQSKTVSVY